MSSHRKARPPVLILARLAGLGVQGVQAPCCLLQAAQPAPVVLARCCLLRPHLADLVARSSRLALVVRWHLSTRPHLVALARQCRLVAPAVLARCCLLQAHPADPVAPAPCCLLQAVQPAPSLQPALVAPALSRLVLAVLECRSAPVVPPAPELSRPVLVALRGLSLQVAQRGLPAQAVQADLPHRRPRHHRRKPSSQRHSARWALRRPSFGPRRGAAAW